MCCSSVTPVRHAHRPGGAGKTRPPSSLPHAGSSRMVVAGRLRSRRSGARGAIRGLHLRIANRPDPGRPSSARWRRHLLLVLIIASTRSTPAAFVARLLSDAARSASLPVATAAGSRRDHPAVPSLSLPDREPAPIHPALRVRVLTCNALRRPARLRVDDTDAGRWCKSATGWTASRWRSSSPPRGTHEPGRSPPVSTTEFTCLRPAADRATRQQTLKDAIG